MKQIFLSKMNKFIFTAMMLAASAALLLSCKHPNNPSPPKVTISIAGDINVTVKDPKSFTAAKESKWSAIKETAQAMVTYKEGYDVLAWKLGSATGADITDDTVFGSDETIFVVSKKVNERTYTVRHLKQNIDDDKYTQAEEETKLGIIDENTAAEAKDYQGFTKPAVTQQKIKADNSTVVEIKYDRKIITLKFKFDGGTTTPVLEGDALKGKFGATVSVTEPTKENYAFNGWEPKLPGTFTLENDNSTYTATWRQPTITVKADERLQVTAPTSMKVNFKTTWGTLKADITGKVTLKTDWSSDYYEIYQWRIGDAAGEKLTNEYVFEKDTTIYVISNYKKEKLNIAGGELASHIGDEPKGTIYIPENVTKINNDAFRDLTNLTNVHIPSGVTSIGNKAFLGCTGVTHITIPDTVDSIGDQAFSSCYSLMELTIPKKVTVISKSLCSGCRDLKTISLQGDVTVINENAFTGCAALTEINIPNTVRTIGEAAFVNCSNLIAVSIPEGVTVIAQQIFDNCSKLETVNLLGTIQSIGMGAFSGCNALRNITIPNTVTEIGNAAFARCAQLTEIVIPNDVCVLGNRVFESCSLLSSVTLPKNMQSIPEGLFFDCGNLTSIVIPPNVTAIGDSAFSGSGLKEISIHNKVQSIGEKAFLTVYL